VKIPVEQAIIPREKLTQYLLVHRLKSDKSQFLAQAGFTLANPDQLDEALRQHLDTSDAIEDRVDGYGSFYRIEGELIGPDGMSLKVITVWVQPANQPGSYRFVTLKPTTGR
jgi:hypothetical protein